MLRMERAVSPSMGTVTMVLVDAQTYEIHEEAEPVGWKHQRGDWA